MTQTMVEFRPVLPVANPAALVAAWLYDTLAGVADVEVATVRPDLIVLVIDPPDARLPVRRIVGSALTESRFDGWQLVAESCSLHPIKVRSSAISHAPR